MHIYFYRRQRRSFVPAFFARKISTTHLGLTVLHNIQVFFARSDERNWCSITLCVALNSKLVQTLHKKN